MLYGILVARGTCAADNECRISVERDPVVLLTERLVREQLGREVLKIKRSHGKEAYILSFTSGTAVGIINDSMTLPLSALKGLRCKDCQNALLRGIFIAAGRVSDPQKNYHLELSFDEPKENISAFLSELGYVPKYTKRRNEHLLYYKDNAVIAELLSHCGDAKAGFAFINAMIEKQYRSDAGRRANCETGNIAKAVEASIRQTNAILLLKEHNLLSSLPSELILTAEYKLRYPDLPLSQLAAMITPTVSKSGLSHRLSKIEEIAKDILSKESKH